MPCGAKAFHCAIGRRASSKPGRGGARRRTRLSRLSCRLQRLLLVSWHSGSFFTSQPQAPFSFEGYQCPLETIERIPPFPGNLAFPRKLRIIYIGISARAAAGGEITGVRPA